MTRSSSNRFRTLDLNYLARRHPDAHVSAWQLVLLAKHAFIGPVHDESKRDFSIVETWAPYEATRVDGLFDFDQALHDVSTVTQQFDDSYDGTPWGQVPGLNQLPSLTVEDNLALFGVKDDVPDHTFYNPVRGFIPHVGWVAHVDDDRRTIISPTHGVNRPLYSGVFDTAHTMRTNVVPVADAQLMAVPATVAWFGPDEDPRREDGVALRARHETNARLRPMAWDGFFPDELPEDDELLPTTVDTDAVPRFLPDQPTPRGWVYGAPRPEDVDRAQAQLQRTVDLRISAGLSILRPAYTANRWRRMHRRAGATRGSGYVNLSTMTSLWLAERYLRTLRRSLDGIGAGKDQSKRAVDHHYPPYKDAKDAWDAAKTAGNLPDRELRAMASHAFDILKPASDDAWADFNHFRELWDATKSQIRELKRQMRVLQAEVRASFGVAEDAADQMLWRKEVADRTASLVYGVVLTDYHAPDEQAIQPRPLRLAGDQARAFASMRGQRLALFDARVASYSKPVPVPVPSVQPTVPLNGTPSDLMRLPGVGKVLSERIAFAGPFQRRSELLGVKGVSTKMLYAWWDQLGMPETIAPPVRHAHGLQLRRAGQPLVSFDDLRGIGRHSALEMARFDARGFVPGSAD